MVIKYLRIEKIKHPRLVGNDAIQKAAILKRENQIEMASILQSFMEFEPPVFP